MEYDRNALARFYAMRQHRDREMQRAATNHAVAGVFARRDQARPSTSRTLSGPEVPVWRMSSTRFPSGYDPRWNVMHEVDPASMHARPGPPPPPPTSPSTSTSAPSRSATPHRCSCSPGPAASRNEIPPRARAPTSGTAVRSSTSANAQDSSANMPTEGADSTVAANDLRQEIQPNTGSNSPTRDSPVSVPTPSDSQSSPANQTCGQPLLQTPADPHTNQTGEPCDTVDPSAHENRSRVESRPEKTPQRDSEQQNPDSTSGTPSPDAAPPRQDVEAEATDIGLALEGAQQTVSRAELPQAQRSATSETANAAPRQPSSSTASVASADASGQSAGNPHPNPSTSQQSTTTITTTTTTAATANNATTDEERWVAPCLVCHVEDIQIAFLPCGHASTCLRCLSQMRQLICPVCRDYAYTVIRIYVPGTDWDDTHLCEGRNRDLKHILDWVLHENHHVHSLFELPGLVEARQEGRPAFDVEGIGNEEYNEMEMGPHPEDGFVHPPDCPHQPQHGRRPAHYPHEFYDQTHYGRSSFYPYFVPYLVHDGRHPPPAPGNPEPQRDPGYYTWPYM